MEHFVLVPVSVYNKKHLNNESGTKQELPKCLTEQHSTYSIDSPKKEVNENVFAKADSSVKQVLSCPAINL